MRKIKLYTGTTTDKDLVAEVPVPVFRDKDPDIIGWGDRLFKRSLDVDENHNWKYIEAFYYIALGVVGGHQKAD